MKPEVRNSNKRGVTPINWMLKWTVVGLWIGVLAIGDLQAQLIEFYDLPPDYAVGDGPESVTAADVDGDGLLDLVTVNNNDFTVSVLRNLANGTFAAQMTYAVGFYPRSVTAADVDGDGAVDLVTANGNTVSVLRNLGDGTFAAQVTYAVGSSPRSVTSADVDSDGTVDLITANSLDDTVSVLRNLGDGTFAAQVTYAVGEDPVSVTAADLDGDGAVDLITANGTADTVSVLRNLGNGSFAAQISYGVGDNPRSVTAVDVDGDSAADLVTANFNVDTVSVLRNSGDGTFVAQTPYAVGDAPMSVTAADVDGDGVVDLVTANYSDDTVSVLRNLGDGTFVAQVSYAVGKGPWSVTMADVGGDGVVDLVTANYFGDTVSVLRNLSDGTFAAQAIYAVSNSKSVAAADVDGDGAVDLVTANYPNTVSVLRNLGNGTFDAQVTFAVGNWPVSVAAADVDGDGAMDLVTVNFDDETVSVLRNLGRGTFDEQVTYAVGFRPLSVTAADVNGDSAVDLVAANSYYGTVSVLRNLGNGTFAAQVTHAVGGSPESVVAADVNGDHAVDLVTANSSGDTLSVLRNLGNGTFAAPVTYAVGDSPESVVAADVDGDGAMDLITANYSDDTLSVLRNLGNGTFAAQVTYAVGNGPKSVKAADVDGDGAVDLATANYFGDMVSVLRNLGNGIFAAQVTYVVGYGPSSLAAADLNVDGAVDLIVANTDDQTVSVLRNHVEPPEPPTNVTASDGSFIDKVQILWTASARATSYEVWRNTTDVLATATKISNPDPTVSSYSDLTAVPGTTYWYWVKAKNGGGKSDFSASNSGCRGYAFYRDQDSDGYGNLAMIQGACTQPVGYVSNDDDCNDSNAAINPSAQEVCDSVDNDCDGFIDEVCPANAPSNLTAQSLSSSAIQLNWTDNSINETGFRVERSADGSTGWAAVGTVGANIKTYQNNGLASSTTYYYRVFAINAVGDSGASNIANATTQLGPPSAPANLAAVAGNTIGSISLTWTDNSSDETQFNIERSLSAGGPFVLVATVGSNVTTYTNSFLAACTTYHYRIRTYNAAGYSAYSNITNAKTTGCSPTPPVGPSDVAARAIADDKITLNWTDNDPEEAGYHVNRATTLSGPWQKVATLGANAISWTDSGLNGSTQYFYKVRAFNAAGKSSWRGPVGAKTQKSGTPDAPSNLVALAVSSTQVDLTWADNSNDETGFKIYRRVQGGLWALLDTVGANVTGYSDSSVSGGTMYEYRVKARNSSGNSQTTNVASVTP